jgi:hypothetical protein
LGYPWLQEFNPEIDWEEGRLIGEEVKLEEIGMAWGEYKKRQQQTKICKTHFAQEWAIEGREQWQQESVETKGIPEEYQRHHRVFSDQQATVTIPRRCAGRPDRPKRTILPKARSMARVATRQRQYNESTFSAQLAEALQQHGMAVRTTHTSSSVMRDIMDQLVRLAGKESKNSSNKDVLAQHGLCGPERPPQH